MFSCHSLCCCDRIAENPNAGGASRAEQEKWELSREEIEKRLQQQNQKHRKKGKGRSENQRLKLFYLLDYLLEETDETHTKKVAEIIEHFENYHKIPVEQKTVCSDLRLLTEYGYETQYDGRTRGWRIIEREFDTQELQLLIDSVQSSRFITQKKAKELTDKLKKKASRFDRVSLDRRCYVPNRVRSDNNSIFYHLDDLHAAIANDWRITFKYFYFTPKKQKAYYKKGELYTASPYALLWSDNNYYLLAYESGKMKHFRVDKMDGIEVLTQKREGKEAFKELKLTERSLRVFSMYSGKVQKVKIRFSNHLANVVIDRFGKDVVMIPDDEKHFTIHTDIEVSPQFFGWVCGLGKAVRILAPAEVVEEMGNYVKGIAEMY